VKDFAIIQAGCVFLALAMGVITLTTTNDFVSDELPQLAVLGVACFSFLGFLCLAVGIVKAIRAPADDKKVEKAADPITARSS